MPKAPSSVIEHVYSFIMAIFCLVFDKLVPMKIAVTYVPQTSLLPRLAGETQVLAYCNMQVATAGCPFLA